MTKKYNDSSLDCADWTTKKLKQEYVALDEMINGELSCFGVNDLILFEAIARVLDKRNINIKTKVYFE